VRFLYKQTRQNQMPKSLHVSTLLPNPGIEQLPHNLHLRGVHIDCSRRSRDATFFIVHTKCTLNMFVTPRSSRNAVDLYCVLGLLSKQGANCPRILAVSLPTHPLSYHHPDVPLGLRAFGI